MLQNAAIEGELVGISVATRIGFKPGQVVARLEVDQSDRLLLVAEMKTPGEALLEFKITPMGKGQVEFELHSRFMPQGLFGLLYWYVLYPFHQYIFFGMLKAMAKSINKPILAGPERFTPKLHTSCALPPKHNH